MSQNSDLRARSGSVDSKDPLVDFMYHLLRDHLPAGEVEEILQKHVFPAMREGDTESQFCNGYLANYAKDITDRLCPQSNLDKVLTAIYDRNVLEGRCRFFASHTVNHDPRTVLNPNYLILWEQQPDAPHDATLVFSGLWNRLLTYLNEIPVGYPVDVASVVEDDPFQAPAARNSSQDLQDLQNAVTREGDGVHAILANPAICQTLLESTDPTFDRETESRLLASGVIGYWHRIPVFRRPSLQTEWALV